jgi:hypothetical protein
MSKPNPILGNKPFKKGQSGNPKGRPKKLPQLDIMMAEVLGDETKGKSYGEAILISLRRKAMSGDVRAAELLLDRAYGKPKQEISANVDTTVNLILKKADGC